jgi:hypothetical protein
MKNESYIASIVSSRRSFMLFANNAVDCMDAQFAFYNSKEATSSTLLNFLVVADNICKTENFIMPPSMLSIYT